MSELPPAGPFWPPETFCPKCVSPRAPSEPACPACGLTFARVRREAFEPSPWLKQSWLEVWADFENNEKHAKILLAAEHAGEITDLARLYRIARVTSKNAARVDKSLNELMFLATQRFNSSMQTDDTRDAFRRWRNYLLVAFSMAVLLWVAWMLKFLAGTM